MVGTAVITVIVTFGILGTAVIVTAVGVILAMTRIVTVIPMAVIAAIATVIGVGALPVVIRPTIAGARATPVALPVVAARLVRPTQGTLMAPPMTAPAGKFAFHYMSTWALRGHPCSGRIFVAGQG